MTKTAIVVGGGIAGTVAALALHRAGFTPVVHEAGSAGADERGAFLTVAVNGLAALRHLDLDPAAVLAAGCPTPRLLLGNGAGRRLADLPLGAPRRTAPPPRRSAAPTCTPPCAPPPPSAASPSGTASAWSAWRRTAPG